MASFGETSKRKFGSWGEVPNKSIKRVRTENGGTDLSKLEATLSAELGFAVLQFLPFRDAIALALTNKGMKSWVLPELYRIHAREAKKDDSLVPLALQWAVWYGKSSVFEASIQAMDEIGLDSNEVVTRTLRQGCELAEILSKGRQQCLPGKVRPVRWSTGFDMPGPFLQLLDIACFRGHFDLVKVLADKAGDISQDPATGFKSHVAYALNADIAKFLINRGASMGTTEDNCAFLGLTRRAILLHNCQDRRRLDDTEQKETDVLATIEYLVNSGHKVSSQYTNICIHPFYCAVTTTSEPKLIRMLFKAVGTSTLTHSTTGVTRNLVTMAMRQRQWEAASLLIDAGGIPEGECVISMSSIWKNNPEDPFVKKLLRLVPVDATANGELLTVRAIKMHDFKLLEMLAKAGFACPDKAIHFGKWKLDRLWLFMAER
ncbi:hypothetical protein PFICI_09773 [Pestalotiopsis fici W106-1]|uniref:Uncharacterized protein n=1 Tax=Pestalotiopsis fici (strain W106-1 / CGMCC3.15140) TaxID=1229662 RepID=W3WXV0_PESFW|nr:uncharacterized protein PFICI_09773 [Pestalotiopsis fici W106-1]ETS77711.1 hypothetical protein PFICI_09773 [Pestalotiopsis fici W106-1]